MRPASQDECWEGNRRASSEIRESERIRSCCVSIAHCTASTTLANSAMTASPPSVDDALIVTFDQGRNGLAAPA
jgi:hypothetical protein